jgi:D-alanine transaminase
MKEISFYNGEFLAYDEALTKVEDRGNTFGDGVYDALSCFNNKPFNLDMHVDRFFNSMDEVKINSPYTKRNIKDIIKQGLEITSLDKAFVYFQITRGTSRRSHAYPDEIIGNFYLVIREKPSYEKYRRNGASIISMLDDRWQRCDIKSLNLLPNVIAAKKASEVGCIEALLIRNGYAAECTASSIFLVKDRVIYTEPLSKHILNGVTRTCLMDIAPKANIDIIERHSSVDDYYKADEVFITSCSKLMLNITKIDDKAISDNHPISDKLYTAYINNVKEQCGEIDKNKI